MVQIVFVLVCRRPHHCVLVGVQRCLVLVGELLVLLTNLRMTWTYPVLVVEDLEHRTPHRASSRQIVWGSRGLGIRACSCSRWDIPSNYGRYRTRQASCRRVALHRPDRCRLVELKETQA